MKTKNLAMLISLPIACRQYALASEETAALKEDARKLKSREICWDLPAEGLATA
jgi:hypothetical protein